MCIFFSEYEGHKEGIKCLAFTPDGEYFASGCAHGLIKLWRANPPVRTSQLIIEAVHDLGVTSCDFSQNYQTVRGIYINGCHIFVLFIISFNVKHI